MSTTAALFWWTFGWLATLAGVLTAFWIAFTEAPMAKILSWRWWAGAASIVGMLTLVSWTWASTQAPEPDPASVETAAAPVLPAAGEMEPGMIHVYKTATCGCCGLWVEHLRESGFEVMVEDVDGLAGLNRVKDEAGVPDELRTCHTALVDGYLVEGHVPADLIRRFLEEKPEARGLVVPGMPAGSPGMEGSGAQPYEVLVFHRSGATTVYAER